MFLWYMLLQEVRQPAGTSISQVLQTLQRNRAQKDLRALICFLLVLLTVGSAVAVALTRMVLEDAKSRPPGQPSSSTAKPRHHRQQTALADLVNRAPPEADTGDTVDVTTTTTKTHRGAGDVANATKANDTTSGWPGLE